MTHRTWHGAETHQNSTGKGLRNVDDVFRRLIEITDQEAYVKSELIMDWISKAQPKQHQVDQVFSEIAVEYLNNSYATFLGDVINSYGYKISDSYDPGMASSFYNSNMIELPKDKVDQLQDKGYHEFDYSNNIKCPVTYCPCFNQYTILTLTPEMGDKPGSRNAVMIHPFSKLEHKIDYWYCGVMTNSKWMHVSFLNNSKGRVCKAMRKSQNIWVGFLIKKRHFIDLSEYWKLYDAQHILEIGKRNEMPRQIQLDLLITWLQFHKPEKDIMQKLWDVMRKLDGNFHYMKTIEDCLKDSGYNIINKIIKHAEAENIIWVKLSKGKQQKLAKSGNIRLECKMKGKGAETLNSKMKTNLCEITIRLTDSVPALEADGYLIQTNGSREFEIRHCFGLSKTRKVMKFVSFYLHSRTELMKIWGISDKTWIGFTL